MRNRPSFDVDDAARSLFQTDTGLNKMRFRASQVADWASVVVLYVVVYPDEVPGPFNRDVNVKSHLSLYAPRERYDRFYIQASTRPQTRRVLHSSRGKECTMHPPSREKKIK